MGLGLCVALLLATTGQAQEAKFDLPGMGGGAASPDNTTLVVALTPKAELVYIDTLGAKETKRVTVEFQPTYLAWGDKVIFAAQKNSGQVHVLDAASGKELGTGNAGGPVRNLVVVKGVCFATTGNREVSAIDAKGTATKTTAQGTFIAADPSGELVYTCIDGKATTDVYQYKVDGTKLKYTEKSFRSLKASLINVQGLAVSMDGKAFGVVAGGGWTDQDRKKRYGIPIYSTDDMKSQLGDLDTGAYPAGIAVHPVLPLLFGCNGKEGSVFNAKSFTAGQKIVAGKEGAPVVLAFVSRGQKLAYGTTGGVLKLVDLELNNDQKMQLNKAYASK
jgi:outer membrane protein assembly factor BamB